MLWQGVEWIAVTRRKSTLTLSFLFGKNHFRNKQNLRENKKFGTDLSLAKVGVGVGRLEAAGAEASEPLLHMQHRLSNCSAWIVLWQRDVESLQIYSSLGRRTRTRKQPARAVPFLLERERDEMNGPWPPCGAGCETQKRLGANSCVFFVVRKQSRCEHQLLYLLAKKAKSARVALLLGADCLWSVGQAWNML